jgi:hypothetical protein
LRSAVGGSRRPVGFGSAQNLCEEVGSVVESGLKPIEVVSRGIDSVIPPNTNPLVDPGVTRRPDSFRPPEQYKRWFTAAIREITHKPLSLRRAAAPVPPPQLPKHDSIEGMLSHRLRLICGFLQP